jgi:hypothetical protein
MNIFESFNWDWNQVIVDLLRIMIVLIIALPIAWQRLSDPRQDTGFRTFPIVAATSCAFLLENLDPGIYTDDTGQGAKFKAPTYLSAQPSYSGMMNNAVADANTFHLMQNGFGFDSNTAGAYVIWTTHTLTTNS